MVLARDGNLKDKVGNLRDEASLFSSIADRRDVGNLSVPLRLTDSRLLSKVNKQGREAATMFMAERPISFVSRNWEVVQSAVHQTLTLIILVRVQASQPNFHKRRLRDLLR